MAELFSGLERTNTSLADQCNGLGSINVSEISFKLALLDGFGTLRHARQLLVGLADIDHA